MTAIDEFLPNMKKDFLKNPKGTLLWGQKQLCSMQWCHDRLGSAGRKQGCVVLNVPYKITDDGEQLEFSEKALRLQYAAAWHLRDKYRGLINSSITIKIESVDYISVTIKTNDVEEYNLFSGSPFL